jgi:hypothetical protein
MYVVLDITISTYYPPRPWKLTISDDNRLGDLIGAQGYLNTSTPFSVYEHTAVWKSDRHYLDFEFTNDYNDSCRYPQFWMDNGLPLVLSLMGCYERYVLQAVII